MPGERLVCVWQAAYALNQQSSDRQLTKKSLQAVVAQMAELTTVRYSKSKFDETFKSDKDVSMSTFRQYLFEVLAEKGVPQCTLQTDIETRCWEISKKLYTYKTLGELNVHRLWEIANRLVDVDSMPPQIRPGVADWFFDKVCTHLGKDWKSISRVSNNSYTVESLFDKLTDDLFADEMEVSVTRAIDELYNWLVREVMKTGWMYKRTRKQANWTNWTKRWFVLTSTRLIYHDNPDTQGSSKKRGELIITGSKVETLPPYKGMIHKLQGRFKVSNLPFIEMELSTEEYKLRHAWVSAIEDVIDASRHCTTPIQRLLKTRWGADKENSPASKQSETKLENIEKAVVENIKPITPEIANSFTSQPPLRPKIGRVPQKASTTSSEESFDNADEQDVIKYSNEKMKAVFMKMDTDGNGKIDKNEFKMFIGGLGLKISDKEINLLYQSVQKEDHSFITFKEFSNFFANTIMDEATVGEAETKLRGAFLKADRDGTGTLNFKEFAEYIWDKKRSIRMSKLINAFDEMDKKQEGQVSYNEFREFYKNRISSIPEVESYSEGDPMAINDIDIKLKEFYETTEADELAKFVRNRWNKFATFKRYGASGQVAMSGGHGMVDDIVPGEYSLLDLALFSDLPPVVPKHVVIKGVSWQKSPSPGKSGQLIFPDSFDGKLVLDTATPEHLRYYGCSFAEGNQLKISLLYRHGIQDFTYENRYLEDYVRLTNGGSGVERHEFSHLDCPLEEDSGNFILAKIVGDDEMHITAFRVPIRHTLYIPGGVIHSNDYLSGTWRTMLSDEADIDHVHLVKGTPPKELTHFLFEFEK